MLQITPIMDPKRRRRPGSQRVPKKYESPWPFLVPGMVTHIFWYHGISPFLPGNCQPHSYPDQ